MVPEKAKTVKQVCGSGQAKTVKHVPDRQRLRKLSVVLDRQRLKQVSDRQRLQIHVWFRTGKDLSRFQTGKNNRLSLRYTSI